MSIFKVMTGAFNGEGKLSSKHSVFEADNAVACWKHIYDTVLDAEGPYSRYTRFEALMWWVEEHHGPGDYDHIWVQHPYPHPARPDVPDWIKHLLSQPQSLYSGTVPLRRDIEAALPKHLVYQLSQLDA